MQHQLAGPSSAPLGRCGQGCFGIRGLEPASLSLWAYRGSGGAALYSIPLAQPGRTLVGEPSSSEGPGVAAVAEQAKTALQAAKAALSKGQALIPPGSARDQV